MTRSRHSRKWTCSVASFLLTDGTCHHDRTGNTPDRKRTQLVRRDTQNEPNIAIRWWIHKVAPSLREVSIHQKWQHPHCKRNYLYSGNIHWTNSTLNSDISYLNYIMCVCVCGGGGGWGGGVKAWRSHNRNKKINGSKMHGCFNLTVWNWRAFEEHPHKSAVYLCLTSRVTPTGSLNAQGTMLDLIWGPFHQMCDQKLQVKLLTKQIKRRASVI